MIPVFVIPPTVEPEVGVAVVHQIKNAIENGEVIVLSGGIGLIMVKDKDAANTLIAQLAAAEGKNGKNNAGVISYACWQCGEPCEDVGSEGKCWDCSKEPVTDQAD